VMLQIVVGVAGTVCDVEFVELGSMGSRVQTPKCAR